MIFLTNTQCAYRFERERRMRDLRRELYLRYIREFPIRAGEPTIQYARRVVRWADREILKVCLQQHAYRYTYVHLVYRPSREQSFVWGILGHSRDALCPEVAMAFSFPDAPQLRGLLEDTTAYLDRAYAYRAQVAHINGDTAIQAERTPLDFRDALELARFLFPDNGLAWGYEPRLRTGKTGYLGLELFEILSEIENCPTLEVQS